MAEGKLSGRVMALAAAQRRGIEGADLEARITKLEGNNG
jgi:hypothetical protein